LFRLFNGLGNNSPLSGKQFVMFHSHSVYICIVGPTFSTPQPYALFACMQAYSLYNNTNLVFSCAVKTASNTTKFRTCTIHLRFPLSTTGLLYSLLHVTVSACHQLPKPICLKDSTSLLGSSTLTFHSQPKTFTFRKSVSLQTVTTRIIVIRPNSLSP